MGGDEGTAAEGSVDWFNALGGLVTRGEGEEM